MADTLNRMASGIDDLGPDSERAALSADQLDYMADLIAEFREMSQRSGLTTLAGILALAQAEAALQLKNRRK